MKFAMPNRVPFRLRPWTAAALAGAAAMVAGFISGVSAAEPPMQKTVHVKRTEPFEVTGDGSAPAWKEVAWESLSKRDGTADYDARFKLLYSPLGLYVLMNGSDERLTAANRDDFLDLWKEDVFEFFLWTDPRHPIYFEYEISPLGFELPILVPNVDGKYLGWRPWKYEGQRMVRKATSVSGGEKKSGGRITAWTAEVFVPFKLLEPLGNVPPKPQTRCARTFIGWTTTAAMRRHGTGRASAPAFTSSRSSAR